MIKKTRGSKNSLFLVISQLKQEIKKIPKENLSKFSVDLFKLIKIAQGKDYDKFEF